MPYATKEARVAYDKRRAQDPTRMRRIRASKRSRHGNHRQVWLNAGGVCEMGRNGSGRCYAYRQLEYHEPFGEDHAGAGKMQDRHLGCLPCHAGDHPEYDPDFIKNRHKPSLLYEDIMAEITEAGSVRAWLDKYGLTWPANLDPDFTLRVLGGNVEHGDEEETE
jgi:hypothetical protein